MERAESLPFFSPAGTALAQAAGEGRAVRSEFHREDGCPIEIESIRTFIDLDQFDSPVASRIYITYKNISPKPVTAVKFRVRFSDYDKSDRGTFHAPDTFTVNPGQTRSQKWKRAGALHPDVSLFLIRALQVRYADGTIWNSTKLEKLKNPDNR
jgi:hypothetical protein